MWIRCYWIDRYWAGKTVFAKDVAKQHMISLTFSSFSLEMRRLHHFSRLSRLRYYPHSRQSFKVFYSHMSEKTSSQVMCGHGHSFDKHAILHNAMKTLQIINHSQGTTTHNSYTLGKIIQKETKTKSYASSPFVSFFQLKCYIHFTRTGPRTTVNNGSAVPCITKAWVCWVPQRTPRWK